MQDEDKTDKVPLQGEEQEPELQKPGTPLVVDDEMIAAPSVFRRIALWILKSR